MFDSYYYRGWFSERGVYSQSSGEGSIFDINAQETGTSNSTATRNYNSTRKQEATDINYAETILPMKKHSRHSSLLDGGMLGGNLPFGGKSSMLMIFYKSCYDTF